MYDATTIRVRIVRVRMPLAAKPIGHDGPHFGPNGQPHCLPYHILQLQNKYKKPAASVYTTRFASALSCALHNSKANLHVVTRCILRPENAPKMRLRPGILP